MLLKEIRPAATNPVPLREFAAHLRLAHGFNDDRSEDGLLELYLRNATAVVERRTAQALISRPYRLNLSSWDHHGHMTMPVGPVAAIDQFRYVGPGSTIDLEPEDWVLEPGTTRQRITGARGGSLWPLPLGSVAELNFAAGHGESWNDVPDDLLQAVITLAAHFYENRFGEVAGTGPLPAGVMAIVDQHSPIRI